MGALPSSHTSDVSNARTSVRGTLRPRSIREVSFTSSSFSLRSPSHAPPLLPRLGDLVMGEEAFGSIGTVIRSASMRPTGSARCGWERRSLFQENVSEQVEALLLLGTRGLKPLRPQEGVYALGMRAPAVPRSRPRRRTATFSSSQCHFKT